MYRKVTKNKLWYFLSVFLKSYKCYKDTVFNKEIPEEIIRKKNSYILWQWYHASFSLVVPLNDPPDHFVWPCKLDTLKNIYRVSEKCIPDNKIHSYPLYIKYEFETDAKMLENSPSFFVAGFSNMAVM